MTTRVGKNQWVFFCCCLKQLFVLSSVFFKFKSYFCFKHFFLFRCFLDRNYRVFFHETLCHVSGLESFIWELFFYQHYHFFFVKNAFCSFKANFSKKKTVTHIGLFINLFYRISFHFYFSLLIFFALFNLFFPILFDFILL